VKKLRLDCQVEVYLHDGGVCLKDLDDDPGYAELSWSDVEALKTWLDGALKEAQILAKAKRA
jgi:hypothetical protein